MSRSLAFLLAAACAASVAEGLYFHVVEGQPRCFIEEVPSETLIVGHYKNPDFIPYGQPNFNGVGIKYEVKDPFGSIVATKPVDTEGRFAFTSQHGGEYLVCFLTNSSRWFGQPKRFRLDLKLDVGESGIDYAEVAKKEHLSDLELEIRRLNDKMKDVMRQQAYQRERESAFRDTSESTNSRVKWWSVIQTAVMITAGSLQVWMLRRFFAKRRGGGGFFGGGSSSSAKKGSRPTGGSGLGSSGSSGGLGGSSYGGGAASRPMFSGSSGPAGPAPGAYGGSGSSAGGGYSPMGMQQGPPPTGAPAAPGGYSSTGGGMGMGMGMGQSMPAAAGGYSATPGGGMAFQRPVPGAYTPAGAAQMGGGGGAPMGGSAYPSYGGPAAAGSMMGGYGGGMGAAGAVYRGPSRP